MTEACNFCTIGSYLLGQSLPGTGFITPYRHQPQMPQRTGDIPNFSLIYIITISFTLGLSTDSWSLPSGWSVYHSRFLCCSWFLHSTGPFHSAITCRGYV